MTTNPTNLRRVSDADLARLAASLLSENDSATLALVIAEWSRRVTPSDES